MRREGHKRVYNYGGSEKYKTYIDVEENFTCTTLDEFSTFIENLKTEHGKDCSLVITGGTDTGYFGCELCRPSTEDEIKKYEDEQNRARNKNLLREKEEYERLKAKFEGNKG